MTYIFHFMHAFKSVYIQNLFLSSTVFPPTTNLPLTSHFLPVPQIMLFD